jgi:WD40 repeat protein
MSRPLLAAFAALGLTTTVVPATEPGPPPRVLDPTSPRPQSRLLGDLRFRHNGAVCGLAYRPDGKALATTNRSSDYTPRVWDLDTGAPTVLPGFQFHGAPNRIAFSPDGSMVYVGGHPSMSLGVGHQGTLCIWGPKSTEPRRMNAILWALSADGKTLVTVEMRHDAPKPRPGQKPQPEPEILRNSGHRVIVWDGAGKESNEVRDFTEIPNAIALSADGRWLAVGHTDGSIRRLNLADKDQDDTRHWLNPKEGPVRWLAFSPDGKRLAATAEPDRPAGPLTRTIRVWDTATAEKVSEFGSHLAPVVGLAFRPDGRLVSVDGQGVTGMWNVEKGESITRLHPNGFYSVSAIALTPDGMSVALSVEAKNRTGGPVVMDLKTGATTYLAIPVEKPVEPPFKLHEPAKAEPVGASVRLSAVDGQVRVTNSDYMKYDLTYHDRAGKEVWKHPASGYTVWVTPDGNVLSYRRGEAGGRGSTYELRGVRYASVDDGVEVRHLKTGELQRTLGGGVSASGGRFWLGPDGKALALAHSDERVRVWDVGTGELRRVLDMPAGWGYLPEFAFSADGRFLFGRGPGIGVVWSLTNDPAERP